ncbi:hypothetical protein DFH06DRAFT_1036082 [Mycena polygramma]|nr:hypothetical protein DFH06DRAFT_1036082 [Mycena polygramma]
MSPWSTRVSSPEPGLSPVQGTSSPPAATQSETGSLNPVAVTSWRERVYSSLHWRSPQVKPIQPSRDVDWERTRLRVTQAVASIIKVTGDSVLPIAGDVLELAPIAGLSVAAKILDSIWKSVQLVQTNRSRCLRITERCADLLVSIHQVVSESGEEVHHELKAPLDRIEQSFSGFNRFLEEQAALSFLARYLKKDDILNEINEQDASIRDCMFLFHTGFLARILQLQLEQKPPTTNAPLLLSPVDSDTAPSDHNAQLEPLDLPIFQSEPEDTTQKDDVSSLSEKLRQVQETENEVDRARDIKDLGLVLRLALSAPNHLAMARILQIPKRDMPTAIILLLREIENEQEQPRNPAGGSPSPRIRALTWPLDGDPARQVALLHRQFMESELEALKRTTRDCSMPIVPESPSLLTGTFERLRGPTEIQVYPPSEPDSLTSGYSGTAITTPLDTDDEALIAERLTLKAGSPWSSPFTSPGGSTIDLSLALERPSDPAEAATALRYRMSLSHAFHHLSVSVPLWTPSPIEVGSVGYLSNSTGAFRTLFTADRPPVSGIRPLTGVTTLMQKQNRTQGPGTFAKGMKIIDKLTSPKSPTYIKRIYEISVFGETAHLIAEKAEYKYYESLDAPKRWFRENVRAILDAHPGECLREELFLVFATLNARDHALFVNHGDSDDLLHTEFHVQSSRKPGEPWGYFADTSPGDATSEATPTVYKVSRAGSGWNTVILSRLRFRLDEKEPTAH